MSIFVMDCCVVNIDLSGGHVSVIIFMRWKKIMSYQKRSLVVEAVEWKLILVDKIVSTIVKYPA